MTRHKDCVHFGKKLPWSAAFKKEEPQRMVQMVLEDGSTVVIPMEYVEQNQVKTSAQAEELAEAKRQCQTLEQQHRELAQQAQAGVQKAQHEGFQAAHEVERMRQQAQIVITDQSVEHPAMPPSHFSFMTIFPSGLIITPVQVGKETYSHVSPAHRSHASRCRVSHLDAAPRPHGGGGSRGLDA